MNADASCGVPLSGGTFLVSGGAGLIGSHIVDQLLEAGARRIVVLDNLTRGSMENLGKAMTDSRVEFHKEDIRNPESIKPWFEGLDGVFHQAAIRITRCADAPRECLEVLIDGTFNLLEAALANGVKKVVAASTASIYGLAESFPTTENHHPYNNRTWYGAAKVACEGMLRAFNEEHGLNYIALRYFNVYGPRMDIYGKYTEVLIRWLDAFENRQPPRIFGSGEQTMDFVYVGDIARANLLAMQAKVSDEVYNVASGTETSLLGLLQALAEAAGVALEGDLAPSFQPERKVNPVPRRLADVSKASKHLGFKASVGLTEGLRQLISWRKQARNTPNAA